VKLLAIGSWDPGSPDIPRLLRAEQQRTAELAEVGLVQEILIRADGTGGYMVLNADSPASAREQLSSLPFMKAGIKQLAFIELTD
jgi:hypothetical protein